MDDFRDPTFRLDDFLDESPSPTERRSAQEGLVLKELPSAFNDNTLPATASTVISSKKPGRPHPEIYVSTRTPGATHTDNLEFTITIDMDAALDRCIVVEIDRGYCLVGANYVRVVDESGIVRVTSRCWCGCDYTGDLEYLPTYYCSYAHSRPKYEYPCERCGCQILEANPSYGTVHMFCSTRCKRARDGVSLRALRAIYDDICDDCEGLVSDETGAALFVGDLAKWNVDEIRLYRLVHRSCLSGRSEAGTLDHLCDEPTIVVPY